MSLARGINAYKISLKNLRNTQKMSIFAGKPTLMLSGPPNDG